jgi:hypothetical protein
MTGRRPLTIMVRCPDCGVRKLGVDDIGFTHARGTVTGWYWHCESCRQLCSASADPAVLGLLHGVGVHQLLSQPSELPPGGLDHRAIVSLRILLDDAGLLNRLVEAAPEQPAAIRPAPPG